MEQMKSKLLALQCPSVELKANEDDQQPPQFTMIVNTGNAMQVEGWRYPVVLDLSGLTIPSQHRPVRFGHNMYAGIGHTERIAIENGVLVADGIVSRDTAIAREVVASGKKGFPWQASVGVQAQETEFVRSGRTAAANNKTFQGPVFVVRRAILGEISFVDLGADVNTSATILANMKEKMMEDEKDETPDQDETLDQDVAEIRAQAVTETRRIGAIRTLCVGHPDIEEKAITEGWTPERCELEVLRASRPKMPALQTPNMQSSPRVLEAALALAGGLEKVEDSYSEQELEAATKQYRGGISLQEVLLEAAWANGYTGRGFRDTRNVLRFAFGQNLQASGFSSVNIGGILSNIANKFLLEGFRSVEQTWRNITAVRNVADFKTAHSYRLIGKDIYEKVAPGGEIKHGTLGEVAYTNRAETYGLMFAIDRRDIINDDLGALTTVPRRLGRGSALKINDVFWSTFLGATGFWTAGNRNIIEGADSALGVVGLTRAEVVFLEQTDPDGMPLGVSPQILLVPPALLAIGTALWKSLEIRDTKVDVRYPIANPHVGKFRVEYSTYLSNTRYTGNSTTAWYLLANPADLATIEVAFLNGQEAPTIETADADFDVLGIRMRGYHDFGVAMQEFRASVRSRGT